MSQQIAKREKGSIIGIARPSQFKLVAINELQLLNIYKV